MEFSIEACKIERSDKSYVLRGKIIITSNPAQPPTFGVDKRELV